MKEVKGLQFSKSKNNYFDIIFVNLIMISAIGISTFLPIFSIALPVLVFIYLSVGLAGFLLKSQQNLQVEFEEIFLDLKILIKSFCVYVIKMFSIIFWAIFLIIPAFICFFNYIFTPFILFEYKDISVKQVFALSKKLAYGYRHKLLLYFLIAIASICIAISLTFGILIFIDVFIEVSKTVYIVLLVLASVLTCFFVALPVFEMAVTDFYIISKHNIKESEIYKEFIITAKQEQKLQKNKSKKS